MGITSIHWRGFELGDVGGAVLVGVLLGGAVLGVAPGVPAIVEATWGATIATSPVQSLQFLVARWCFVAVELRR